MTLVRGLEGRESRFTVRDSNLFTGQYPAFSAPMADAITAAPAAR